MHETWRLFLNIMRRELRIHWGNKAEIFATFLMFIIICSLLPLVAGQLAVEQLWIVPCILWIAALISNVLAQEHLLRNDYKLGIFEQLMLSKIPLPLALCAKIAAHWIVVGLPLIICTPLLGLAFNLPWHSIQALLWSMIIGTPLLCLLGSIAAAITVSLSRGAVLLMILLLPLYVPVLVLGASAGILSLQGMPYAAQLALLAALTILALMLAPFATSAAIKASTA